MKNIFVYLRKVWRNKDNVYIKENELLKNSFVSLFICIAFIALLVFPFGRILLKYSTYVFLVILAIMALGSCVSDIRVIWRSYKYAKRLEKLGSSVEEQEMARRKLCDLEGDDGLNP